MKLMKFCLILKREKCTTNLEQQIQVKVLVVLEVHLVVEHIRILHLALMDLVIFSET